MLNFPAYAEIRDLIELAKHEDLGSSNDDVTSRLLSPAEKIAVAVGMVVLLVVLRPSVVVFAVAAVVLVVVGVVSRVPGRFGYTVRHRFAFRVPRVRPGLYRVFVYCVPCGHSLIQSGSRLEGETIRVRSR